MTQGKQTTATGQLIGFSDTDIEFDAERGTYRTTFDPTTNAPSDVVVETVSAVTGTAPLDLEPLYSAVDPDALDSFFVSTASGTNRTGLTTFAYRDCEVTVSADGVVLVDPFTSDASN